MRFRFPFSVGLPRRVLSISFCLFLTLTVYGQIPEPELVVTLTGDLYLGSHLEPKLKTDPAYPFLYLQDFCQETDIFFANLETPLSTKVKYT